MAEAPAPGLDVARQRKRRFHHRSRNSCVTCKARHVRCDETRPKCTNCVRIGGACGYPRSRESKTSTSGASNSSAASLESPRSPQSTAVSRPQTQALQPTSTQSLFDLTPNHLLAGYPLDTPYKSRWLFHIFAHMSVFSKSTNSRSPGSYVLRKALSHPALLHSALLLTAIEHSIQIKTMEPMKWLFLYHKDALYRFVQEQIRSPETAMQDVTMAAISTMCLADSSIGNLAVSQHHAFGLGRIAAMRAKAGQKQLAKPTLPWRLINMVVTCLAYDMTEDISWVLPDMRSSMLYQPVLVALLFKASWPPTLAKETARRRQGEWAHSRPEDSANSVVYDDEARSRDEEEELVVATCGPHQQQQQQQHLLPQQRAGRQAMPSSPSPAPSAPASLFDPYPIPGDFAASPPADEQQHQAGSDGSWNAAIPSRPNYQYRSSSLSEQSLGSGARVGAGAGPSSFVEDQSSPPHSEWVYDLTDSNAQLSASATATYFPAPAAFSNYATGGTESTSAQAPAQYGLSNAQALLTPPLNPNHHPYYHQQQQQHQAQPHQLQQYSPPPPPRPGKRTSKDVVHRSFSQPFVPPTYPQHGWWERTGERTNMIYQQLYNPKVRPQHHRRMRPQQAAFQGSSSQSASAADDEDEFTPAETSGFTLDPANPRLIYNDARRTRTVFAACFTYLVQGLHRVRMDPFIAHWFLDCMLQDLERAEDAVVRGLAGGEAWLLVAVMGLAVVEGYVEGRDDGGDADDAEEVGGDGRLSTPNNTNNNNQGESAAGRAISAWSAARAAADAGGWGPSSSPGAGVGVGSGGGSGTSAAGFGSGAAPVRGSSLDEEEERSVEAWRAKFGAKVRLACRVLGVTDWDGAREALRKFAWVQGFDGEEEIRALWEEAMAG